MHIVYNFYTITSLLIFISSTLFGIAVYSKNTKQSLNKAFGLFALSVSGWSLFYYIWQISNTENQAFLYTRLLMAFAIFIPANYFFIVLAMIEKIREKKWQLTLAYILSFGFLMLDATPLMVRSIEPTKYHSFWPMAGQGFGVFLVVWFLIILYPTLLLYGKIKSLEGEKRKQLIMIMLGIFIAFVGGSTNYFQWFGIQIPPIGNALGPIWVVLIGYAIIKHNLLNIKLVASEMALYLISSILLVETLFSKSLIEFVLRGIVLIVAIYVSYIAIKSIKTEHEQNKAISRQARQLEHDKKELVELDRMKDEFLQMATHELNTPITAIQGKLDMAVREDLCKLNSEQKAFLEPILNETTRLGHLSRDVLNTARIDQHRMAINRSETDLDALISDTINNFEIKAKEQGDSIAYIPMSKSLPKLNIDQSKIGEVITNLIGNAIKFTEKGKIAVTSRIKDGEVIISVSDTGVGIDKEGQKHLFEKFYQAGRFDPENPQEQQGTGLGLYISQNIINLHGGKMWLESVKDKGSSFYFSLPLEYKEDKAKDNATARKPLEVELTSGKAPLNAETKDPNTAKSVIANTNQLSSPPVENMNQSAEKPTKTS